VEDGSGSRIPLDFGGAAEAGHARDYPFLQVLTSCAKNGSGSRIVCRMVICVKDGSGSRIGVDQMKTEMLPPPLLSCFSSSLLLSSLKFSDTKVYEPEIRARLGTAAHFDQMRTEILPPPLPSRHRETRPRDVCGPRTRCRANMAHTRQSRPDYGVGFQVKVIQTC